MRFRIPKTVLCLAAMRDSFTLTRTCLILRHSESVRFCLCRSLGLYGKCPRCLCYASRQKWMVVLHFQWFRAFPTLLLIMSDIYWFLREASYLDSLRSTQLDRRRQTCNIVKGQLPLMSFQGQSVCGHLRFCAIGLLSLPSRRLVRAIGALLQVTVRTQVQGC